MTRQIHEGGVRHRVVVAVTVTLAWHLLLFATVEIVPPMAGDFHYILINIITAALPLSLVWWFGWWRGAGLEWRAPRRGWLVAIPIPLVSLTYLLDGVQ